MLTRVDYLTWAPLIAAILHIGEEFVWPGGFPRWYRTYRADARTVNRRFLVIINVGLVITLIEAAVAVRTPIGPPALLLFSAILFSNGCWHQWAAFTSRSYSPGMISGGLVYPALLLFEYIGWGQLGRVSPWMAALAFLVGIQYPLWSALFHRQPAPSRPGPSGEKRGEKQGRKTGTA